MVGTENFTSGSNSHFPQTFQLKLKYASSPHRVPDLAQLKISKLQLLYIFIIPST